MPSREAIRLCRQLLARGRPRRRGERARAPGRARGDAGTLWRGPATRRAGAETLYEQLGQHALRGQLRADRGQDRAACGRRRGRRACLQGELRGARAMGDQLGPCHAGGGARRCRSAQLGQLRRGRALESPRRGARRDGRCPDAVPLASLRARIVAPDGQARRGRGARARGSRLAEETDAPEPPGEGAARPGRGLRLARPARTRPARRSEQAIELFERKGNTVAARRARALLAELAPA